MFIFSRLFLVTFLICPVLLPQFVKTADEESPEPAASQEDSLEDETTVETEEKMEQASTGLVSDSEPVEDDSRVDGLPKPSPDADTVMVVTEPRLGHRSSGAGLELPAGQLVRVLVGFTHKGGSTQGDFTINMVEGAFRYPQDYSYYMQNFTAVKVARSVEPKRQASLVYAFTPAQQLAGRPFGLTLRLHYHDSEGKEYVHAVFNDTVMVVELDEGFDTEAFFLYVLIAAAVVVLCLAFYHVFVTYGGKKLVKRSTGRLGGPMEMGTTNVTDVDYDWIPKEHLELRHRKSPPRMSPRQRKSKREGNHGEE